MFVSPCAWRPEDGVRCPPILPSACHCRASRAGRPQTPAMLSGPAPDCSKGSRHAWDGMRPLFFCFSLSSPSHDHLCPLGPCVSSELREHGFNSTATEYRAGSCSLQPQGDRDPRPPKAMYLVCTLGHVREKTLETVSSEKMALPAQLHP